jgi:hypothetical protein
MNMTVPEAAEFFGVSERTIFRRLKSGALSKKLDSKELIITVDSDTVTDEVVSTSVEDDSSVLAIKELQLELDAMKLQLVMKDQQIEFFRNETQRLQLQLASQNQGLFARLRGLFGLRRELPQTEGLT